MIRLSPSNAKFYRVIPIKLKYDVTSKNLHALILIESNPLLIFILTLQIFALALMQLVILYNSTLISFNVKN